MNNRAALTARRVRCQWLRRALAVPFDITRVALESAVTRRGVVLLFFALAALLTMIGWLRPPLSTDIRGHHIPLQLSGNAADATLLLTLPRQARLDSPGGLLLVAIVLGGAWALYRPDRVPTAAGILLSLAIVANAVVTFNYPLLVDLMDSEGAQREAIVRVLVAHNADSLSNGGEPRIIPAADASPLLRGYDYLLYGPWLVTWSALGVLLGARGTLARRFGRVALYSLCGAVSAAMVCSPRLRAEVHWASATRHEARGEWAEARRSLDLATACYPELKHLQRTSFLKGKLDFRQGRPSLDQEVWRIDQWRRNDQRLKAVAMMDSLLDQAAGDRDVARSAAQLFTRVGLTYWDEGRWTAAGELWRKATTLDAQRWDCRFLLGNFQAQMDRDRPELVEAEFSPILKRLADRVLRADILANLGDAYFDAGQMQIARQHYEESLRAFELPKDINYRARKGLVGM